MKKTIERLLLSLFFLIPPAILEARRGKVFYSQNSEVVGNIFTERDELGKEIVTVTAEWGKLHIPKSLVKGIVYDSAPIHSALRTFLISRNSQSRSPTLYDSYIHIASQKNKLDPDLVKAVIKQESNFNRFDISTKGARGLMQLMPRTARLLGVENIHDPWENIHGGTRFLREMLETFQGDLPLALAAYNAGPMAVKRYGTIPPYPETQKFVRNVLRYYQSYRDKKIYTYESKNGTLIFTDQPYFH